MVFQDSCRVGHRRGESGGAATLVGWSNVIPGGAAIGAGCTLYPHLDFGRLEGTIGDGEVIK